MSGDVGVNLMVRRSCLTPQAIGDDWLKHNIFQSTCTILGKVCIFVVDPGSCDNLIAEEVVQKLGLKTEILPKPYKLQWLKEGGEVTVSKRALVTFLWEQPIKIVFGVIWCPWMLITYCWITLILNKPKELVNKPTSTLLTLSQFEYELEMGDEVHKVVHDNLVRANSKYKQDADQKR
ncbi:hypothetical protein Tco_1214268 [Tanacetum coccineum]